MHHGGGGVTCDLWDECVRRWSMMKRNAFDRQMNFILDIVNELDNHGELFV